jgi:hypothetical protein
MPDPTISSQDASGYNYVETSPWWKQCCSGLPSFSEVWWPDYSTKVVDIELGGKPLVVQLWKGWCQKFLGRNDFPGGIGAEVGLYQREDGRAPPDHLEGFPPKISDFLLGGLSRVGGEHLWWPYPDGATITFDLINPKTGLSFFSAAPEQTYWLNRWMDPTSYEKYKAAQPTPIFSAEYTLKYTINGVSYAW